MNDIETTADSLLKLVVGFDPTQDQPARRRLDSGAAFETRVADETRRYLSTNEASWIFPRTQIHSVLSYLSQEGDGAAILYGEPGSGKSSLLRSIWGGDAFANEIVVFDFHSIESKVYDRPQQADTYIRTYIWGVLREQVLPRTFEDPEVTTRLRHSLVKSTGFDGKGENGAAGIFDPVLDQLEESNLMNALTSPEEFQGALDRSPELREALDACEKLYRDAVPRIDRDIARLAAFANTLKRSRLVLAFDNADRLPVNAQITIADTARGLSVSGSTNLPVIISCRSESVVRLGNHLDTIKRFAIGCTPGPLEETSTGARDTVSLSGESANHVWDVHEILKRRLDVLKDNLLWTHLKALDGIDPVLIDQLRTAVNDRVAHVNKFFTNVWPNHAIESDSAELELAESLTLWHNGSIREIALSLYSIARSPEVDGSSPSPLSPSSGARQRRLRNTLYRHLLFFPDEVPAWRDHSNPDKGSTLSRSTDVFLPEQADVTDSHYPFFFGRYRLLRYMTTNRGIIDRRDIYGVFLKYGVQKGDVDLYIEDLLGNNGGQPMLRFDEVKHDDRTIEALELLPAGEHLARRLCFTVEFMYWSAVGSAAALTILKAKLDRFAARGARIPSDQHKVDVAAVYFLDFMLPRFKQEHPYLSKAWSPSDQKRLSNFRRDFGFYRDAWFIDRAVNSITNYAERAGVTIGASVIRGPGEKTISEQLDAVGTLSARLTNMLDNG